MKLVILAVACFLTCNVAEARWFVRVRSVDVQKSIPVQKGEVCGAGGCGTIGTIGTRGTRGTLLRRFR